MIRGRAHDYISGGPVAGFTADDYLEIVAELLRRKTVRAVAPLSVPEAGWLDISMPEGFYATLSGASSPYSWVEKQGTSTGGWQDRVRTGTANAYEVNGVSGLAGNVAWLEPGYPGDYRFQWVAFGAAPCSGTICTTVRGCASALLPGASVTITKHVGGASVGTCTTNGSGVCCVATSSTEAYDILASATGYFDKTFTTASICTTSTTITLSTSVLTVTVTGCGGLPLPGATVLLKEAGVTIDTATTDGSGVATFTLAHPIISGTTVVAQKTRFVDSSPVSVAATACTASIAMTTAATGYVCCGACPDPLPTTLNATVDGEAVTLVFDGIGFWYGCYVKSEPGFVYVNGVFGGTNFCSQVAGTVSTPFAVKFGCDVFAVPSTSAQVYISWPSTNFGGTNTESPTQYGYICPSGPPPLGGFPCSGADFTCADRVGSFFGANPPVGCTSSTPHGHSGLIDDYTLSTVTCGPYTYSGTADIPQPSGTSAVFSITSIGFVISE